MNVTTLRRSIQQLYYELLVALALKDFKNLDMLCERNLVNEFKKGIEWMEPQIKKLRVRNLVIKDEIDVAGLNVDNIDIRIVDYHHTLGSFIDRDMNKRLGLQRSDKTSSSHRNFDHYVIDPELSGTIEMPEKLTMNI